MPDTFAVDAYLRSVAERVESWLRALLDEQTPLGPPDLWAAVRHAVLSGGKRLRPALVLASAQANGGDTARAP
ncbi:MAG TPA: hypothetical protein VFG59_04990 [Anaeromyxobacter sp.]|nr:hypothetical protein [Anaeromyxobacter sp.]